MKKLAVAYVRVDALTPYAKNARTHSEAQIGQLAQSIRKFGWTNPILVDGAKGIIAGHGRLAAAKALGMTEVPVIELAGLTAAEKRAYILADNKLALNAGWDEALLTEELRALGDAGLNLEDIGFSADELTSLLADKTAGLTDPDDVPDVPADPVSRNGDLWILGNHRLICGDSTDAAVVDAAIGSVTERASLVFTSPPYGVGLDYGTYIDSFDNCRALLVSIAPAIAYALRPGGFCITNFGDIISARGINRTEAPSEYPMALEYWPAFTGAGFVLHSRRVWAKPHARVAAPWCASSNRAASDWEHLWTWLKPGGDFLNERRDPSYLGVWDTSKMEGVDIGKDVHPAAFPVSIATLGIEVYSNVGDIVFEPFGGTGTMLIAAEKTSRRCAMVELDVNYCDMSVKRWEAFTGQDAVLAGTDTTFAQIAAQRAQKAA